MESKGEAFYNNIIVGLPDRVRFCDEEGNYKTIDEIGDLHWISVLLPDAPDDIVQFLVNVSFEATKDKRKGKSK